MDALCYSDARANFRKVMDRVIDDRTPVVITRRKAQAVVMITLADWNAMQEKIHPLSSPKNAER